MTAAGFLVRLSFDTIDDSFTVESFKAAYKEYWLSAHLEQPGLLLKLIAEERRR